MGHDNEASVEEILESIKKVIARDNRDDALQMRQRRENQGVSRSVTFDTDVAPDEDERNSEVLDLAEMDFIEDADVHGEDQELDEESSDETPLTNATVANSMRENFAALAMLAEPGAQPQIVRSGETSLEGLVRDMLRPMLAEWLDKNLPGMVEKMVQAEIARIAGKRG